MMRGILSVTVLVLLMSVASTSAAGARGEPEYEPTFESLARHSSPKWFNDGKFGVFIHWGPTSVPAHDEWYQWGMQAPGRGSPYGDTWQWHADNYGTDFGYDDFFPLFTADRFDPKAWVRLIQDAGAKYFVLTSKHHDGYALFDSELSDRTSVAQPPHRDLVAELFDAAERYAPELKRGAYYSLWEFVNPAFTGQPVRNPYTGEEIPYTGFKPVSSFPGFMNDQMRELIDRYDPDLIWCDGDWERNAAYWNLAGTVAHYYNQAQDRRHPKGVAINDRCKLQDGGRQPDYLTPERRTLDYIEPYKWETAETIAGWFYFDEPYRLIENEQLLEMLIDIVSKNGNLLLNVSPRADGTIPDYQQQALREIGRWLDINGEAIYGTTYWSQSSDPTANVPVRFTQRRNAFYATALEWPGEQLSLPGHVPTTAGTKIRLLGADDAKPLTWRKQGGRLVIDTPAGGAAATASAYAYTFKVSTPGLPLIRTTFDAPAELKRGDVAPVKVTVTNPGETSTPPGEVGLGLSGGDGVTAEPAAFSLPRLKPGASTTFETTLRVATDAPYGPRTLTATLRMRRHTIETPLSIPVSRPNHALDMPSTQSSTDFGGEARRANDGNTDGNYFNNSISHTGFDTNAWWQVDLGESRPIHEIEVWNRTDCCTDRLQDYYVLVSDEPFAGQSLADTLAQPGVWHSRQQAQAGRPTTIPVGRSGRYVRVQLAGQNWLTIGEVRVLGE